MKQGKKKGYVRSTSHWENSENTQFGLFTQCHKYAPMQQDNSIHSNFGTLPEIHRMTVESWGHLQWLVSQGHGIITPTCTDKYPVSIILCYIESHACTTHSMVDAQLKASSSLLYLDPLRANEVSSWSDLWIEGIVHFMSLCQIVTFKQSEQQRNTSQAMLTHRQPHHQSHSAWTKQGCLWSETLYRNKK